MFPFLGRSVFICGIFALTRISFRLGGRLWPKVISVSASNFVDEDLESKSQLDLIIFFMPGSIGLKVVIRNKFSFSCEVLPSIGVFNRHASV